MPRACPPIESDCSACRPGSINLRPAAAAPKHPRFGSFALFRLTYASNISRVRARACGRAPQGRWLIFRELQGDRDGAAGNEDAAVDEIEVSLRSEEFEVDEEEEEELETKVGGQQGQQRAGSRSGGFASTRLFGLQWEMRDLDTSEWTDCSQYHLADPDAGSSTPDLSFAFRVDADADDKNRPPSSCRITFAKDTPVEGGAGGGVREKLGQLAPGSYRMVYEEAYGEVGGGGGGGALAASISNRALLPLAVSSSVFVVRRPQVVASSHPPHHHHHHHHLHQKSNAVVVAGGQSPFARRMREAGASIDFFVDGKLFDSSSAKNLSVHVVRRPPSVGTLARTNPAGVAADADSSSGGSQLSDDELYRFIPRLDLVRGNVSATNTTVCVRLPPHLTREELGDDYVALFPYPIPTTPDGRPDLTRAIAGTVRRVADFFVSASAAGAGGGAAAPPPPPLLQHGCLCLVPLWDGLARPQLDLGLYQAVLVHKPLEQRPGYLSRFTSMLSLSAAPTLEPAAGPTIVSASGQFVRVNSEYVVIEEDQNVYRPPLDPMAVFDPVARGGKPEVEDDGYTPTESGLRARYLVPYVDDDQDERQAFRHVAPRFLKLHRNLCVWRVVCGVWCVRVCVLACVAVPCPAVGCACPCRTVKTRQIATLTLCLIATIEHSRWRPVAISPDRR